MTARRDSAAPRRVILLGSTGSIGRSTLEVIEHLRTESGVQFEVAGLAAGANAELLLQQAKRLGATELALAAPGTAPSGARMRSGKDSALRLVEEVARPGDIVVAAMVGAAGIGPVLAAIERGCDIALANKETLVAAGAVVTAAARRHGVQILPVDSEHSAVFQCLNGEPPRRGLRRVVLTASGGPFRNATAAEMALATPAQALRHPTWNMGRKVTIDSATMMNKALEVIEAHWLFGLSSESIGVVVHPQSLIHAMVEFDDGSVLAQVSPPDMRLPIQVALTWPGRHPCCTRQLDWTAASSMELLPVDHARFPAVRLAWRVIDAGGASGAVLNAANEVGVEAFLGGAIPFPRIAELATEALDALGAPPASDLASIMEADRAARDWARGHLARAATSTR